MSCRSLSRECLADGVSAAGQTGVPHLTQQPAPLPVLGVVFAGWKEALGEPPCVSSKEKGWTTPYQNSRPFPFPNKEKKMWLSAGGTAQKALSTSVCF